MDRRKFIGQTSLASGGLVYSSSLIGNARKGDLYLGKITNAIASTHTGASWMFKRYPVKDCHEMVQDSKGRIILLTNEAKNNVIIYDKKGKLIDTWGNEYPGAHGLTLFNENGEEVLFICDNNRHQVIKTTLMGKC